LHKGIAMSESITVPVTLHRTEAWLLNERLKTGRNVPEEIIVHVDPATLSEDARAVWLKAAGGLYRQLVTLGYYQDYTLATTHVGRGRIDLVCNHHTPGPGDVSAAILAAVASLESKKAQDAAKRAESAQREAEEKALREAREAIMRAARETLADELAALTKERDYYRSEAKKLQAEIDAAEEVETD
jgi:hypothetical protein